MTQNSILKRIYIVVNLLILRVHKIYKSYTLITKYVLTLQTCIDMQNKIWSTKSVKTDQSLIWNAHISNPYTTVHTLGTNV